MYPSVAYPFAVDDDHTLFRVFNNTQSVLTSPLHDDSTKIEIKPQSANDAEIWPENGFVSLPGELVYYDDVEKNENGKVCKLIKCQRAVEGVAKYNNINTPVFGNVVAQHHNQLVEAIIEIEKTIGELSDLINEPSNSRQTASFTMHTAMNSMLHFAPVGDDTCPDVEFKLNSEVPVPGGIEAEFCVRIFPWNASWSYSLDFGDGESTTTEFSGTHTWASGGPYTPKVTLVTPRCTIVQQPATPEEGAEITPSVAPAFAFHVAIPEFPDFPSFVAPRRTCPGNYMNLPPIMVPQVNTCSNISVTVAVAGVSIIGASIPSEIVITGCCPPSVISFEGCNLPSIISHIGCCELPSVISYVGFPPSVISLDGCCLPSIISVVGCDLPSIISIDGSLPSIITVDGSGIPTSITVNSDIPSVITIEGCNIPSSISVDWGTPPPIVASVILICGASQTAQGVAPMYLDDNFQDKFNEDEHIPVTVGDLGIPEEIRIIAPEPIQVIVPTIPDIKIIGPEKPLPEQINIIGNIPDTISVVSENLSISLDATDLPRKIIVEPAPNFPSIIRLEAFGIPETLQVVGIPKSIEIVGNIPETIQLLMPEDPTIELVYKGAPSFELKMSSELEKLFNQMMIAKP